MDMRKVIQNIKEYVSPSDKERIHALRCLQHLSEKTSEVREKLDKKNGASLNGHAKNGVK